jgi:hypothetical protein
MLEVGWKQAQNREMLIRDLLTFPEAQHGYNFLCNNNRYCCLARACESVGVPAEECTSVVDAETIRHYKFTHYSSESSSALPHAPWFTKAFCLLASHNFLAAFAALNDSRQYTFREIAYFFFVAFHANDMSVGKSYSSIGTPLRICAESQDTDVLVRFLEEHALEHNLSAAFAAQYLTSE